MQQTNTDPNKPLLQEAECEQVKQPINQIFTDPVNVPLPEQQIVPLPRMATPLSPHEEEIAKSSRKRLQTEQMREIRQLRVDHLIRSFNLQVPPRVRMTLRPLDFMTSIVSLESQLGEVHALVTDGLLAWIQVKDGRIEIVHFDNLNDKTDPREQEIKDKVKQSKKVSKQQVKEIQSELESLQTQLKMSEVLFKRGMIPESILIDFNNQIQELELDLQLEQRKLDELKEKSK